MKLLAKIALLTSTFILCTGAWFAYHWIHPKPPHELFKTQKPEKRDIYKVVPAEGSLEAHGTSKVGSLINAKVAKIYVKEGDKVTAGDLLATLENDKGGDADLRKAQADLKNAQAIYDYMIEHYAREKKLFENNQRSRDAFQKVTQELISAQAIRDGAQAVYDKESFLLAQTQVKAPHDGIIVSIPTKLGQAFSLAASPPQTLFEIAQKLDTMKATLLIDENKMGDVAVGMSVRIEVDAFPHKKPWKGTIASLGLGKATGHTDAAGSTAVMYEAEVDLQNPDGLLRPGMSVHAKIRIAHAKQVLTVPGYVFQLNGSILEQAAKSLSYSFKAIDQAQKKELFKKQTTNPIKTLWIKEEKSIIERAVTLGVTDNAYFEIIDGISESDEIIADDMTASEELKKIAQQMAGS